MQATVADTTVSITTERIDGDIAGKLERYLSGERIVFEEPVDLGDLTDFQQRVLRKIRCIGYGETITYMLNWRNASGTRTRRGRSPMPAARIPSRSSSPATASSGQPGSAGTATALT
jgi:hypothetical protein